MTQSRGLRYRPSGAELEALWHQRKKGESLQEIAKALGMSLSAVYGSVGGYPNAPGVRVWQEPIYRALYAQARGVLKKQLMAPRRRRRRMRRARAGRASRRGGRAQFGDAVSISGRPPSVEDRAVPGH